ncbi:MmcQ/YjbR family DNA-binding protein [Nereida sp. MMG025]|uniref:MmcQ/YjbR family DNA-binding protein n=1 Tax=Nereida sp. MMG025 TaxID=2909981 RepID=UPI001F47F3EA|nr:MmcQ/YjbR family DNA-binding protein [Nereida sp. MMG025]MCF6443512.1 MmcQ/YjbR family DNA-binding protein [Nereida sp. MMG025]
MQTAHDICAAQPGATYDQPFGPETHTYKVGGKLFALWKTDGISLKAADPEQAAFLIDIGVAKPAPYLKRGGWMWIAWDSFQDTDDLRARLTTSYATIRASLPKKVQASL